MIREPTMDDLLYIGARLCAADRRELALTRDPGDYVALAQNAWDCDFKRVAIDEVPLMAFGARQMAGDTAWVWGFKTERGRSAVRQVTKYIRGTMIPALRSRGMRKAFCLVDPANHASQRWLRHLGFRPEATVSDFGTEILLFKREEPDAV